ncbi:MAG: hypothetical protein GXP13_08990 [Gammaproteobacteria bacterium]|nr:hypothetical protein [Gammaproteobacteria bacterium]
MKRFLFTLLPVIFIACGGSGGNSISPVVLKGDRILSIDTTVAGDANYDNAITLAQSVGMQVTSLVLNWSDIETAPGVYDNTLLAIANNYYPAKGIAISLGLRTINTTRKEVPADLQNTAFDDPVMISRFKQFLDFVFAQIPGVTIDSLSIGNEIDVYLGANTTAWQEYRTFYTSVSTYARSIRSNLKIGAKVTFTTINSSINSEVSLLNNASDIIMTTYYPLNPGFTVKSTNVIINDFDKIVSLYPNKPIYFMELGFPSGALCNSSESLQVDFIRATFDAWDSYNKNIKMISFTWLNDLPAQVVQDLTQYYGINNPVFAEYLATLGLRTNPGAGADKLAFTALGEETAKRGW